MGGPQCHLSILRNGNVPCHYFNFLLSILKGSNVACRIYEKVRVALSNLRAKGPYYAGLIPIHK